MANENPGVVRRNSIVEWEHDAEDKDWNANCSHLRITCFFEISLHRKINGRLWKRITPKLLKLSKFQSGFASAVARWRSRKVRVLERDCCLNRYYVRNAFKTVVTYVWNSGPRESRTLPFELEVKIDLLLQSQLDLKTEVTTDAAALFPDFVCNLMPAVLWRLHSRIMLQAFVSEYCSAPRLKPSSRPWLCTTRVWKLTTKKQTRRIVWSWMPWKARKGFPFQADFIGRSRTLPSR